MHRLLLARNPVLPISTKVLGKYALSLLDVEFEELTPGTFE